MGFSFGLLIYYTSTSLKPSISITGQRKNLVWPIDDIDAFGETEWSRFIRVCCELTDPMLDEQPDERPAAEEVHVKLECLEQCIQESIAARANLGRAAIDPPPPADLGVAGS